MTGWIRFILICLWLSQSLFLGAQRGGQRVFEFIHLTSSARSTALGGSQIAAPTNDYGFVGGNPAMLNRAMDRTFTFQHNFHFVGIYSGTAGYAAYMAKPQIMLHGGVHYLSYGKFVAADDKGNIEGEFKAKDLSIHAGISRQLNERMNGGVLLRYIQSSLETYTATGLAIDAGLTYHSEDELNHYTLVLRGAGVQLATYFEGDDRGKMPVDVQFGFSKRLKYVPFRLSVLAHDLHRWDLRYKSPLDENDSPGINDKSSSPGKFGEELDNFFRHLVFGGEFLIGRNEGLMLRIGYHHQRRRELSVVNLRSLAGFSGGVGVNLGRFVLDYGFAVYHQAGASKHLGIRVSLGQLEGKKIVD